MLQHCQRLREDVLCSTGRRQQQLSSALRGIGSGCVHVLSSWVACAAGCTMRDADSRQCAAPANAFTLTLGLLGRLVGVALPVRAGDAIALESRLAGAALALRPRLVCALGALCVYMSTREYGYCV